MDGKGQCLDNARTERFFRTVKYDRTAILDRLLHHAHVVNIRGGSYRLKSRAKTGMYATPNPLVDGDPVRK